MEHMEISTPDISEVISKAVVFATFLRVARGADFTTFHSKGERSVVRLAV
jgi:hypothetical protein